MKEVILGTIKNIVFLSVIWVLPLVVMMIIYL